jgi:Flp pilus assembly protein TadG
MARISAWLTGFGRNERAAVALMFGVSVVPFIMAAGLALDYSRAIDLKTEMQSALDAAALAAAASRSLTDAQRITVGETAFAANFRSRFGVKAAPRITVANQTVRASAAAALPTSFMKLAGLAKMDVGASVEIRIPGQKNAEIALVLDYSASMTEPPAGGGGVKYLAMRDAAAKMVDDLTAGEGATHVKFALVPFSHHVWTTLPGSMVVGQKEGTTWTGCTQDRKYPYNITVATPDPANDDSKWGQALHPKLSKIKCGSYVPNGLVVRPLSSDHAAVKRQLQAMRPYSMTHIALGFEFGWHVLSSNAPFTEGVPESDKTTMKVLVLLTDGYQTEQAFGPHGSETVEDGERNLESLCRNAKAAGITVATVALDLDDASTVARLRNCASDPNKLFFDARTGSGLAAAFDSIKSQLQEAIYIAK